MQALRFQRVEWITGLWVDSVAGRAAAAWRTLAPALVSLAMAVAAALGAVQEIPDRLQAVPTFAVYGDLDVERGGHLSGRLRLALEDRFGRTVRSLIVTDRVEFRFGDLPVGDYTLVLRDGLHELGRVSVSNENLARTEVRVDLLIRAPAEAGAVGREHRGGITFARPTAHQSYWESAAEMAGQGQWEDALQMLEKISTENPVDFEAWNETGAAHYRLGHWDEAEAAWVRATEARPDYFPPWFNLGKLRFSQGDPEGAIEALTEAVRLRPSSAAAQYFLGECYLAVQLGSKAVPHLEEAIRLDPKGMAEVHLRLATLYDRAGYQAKAAEEYQRYLEKRPKAPDRKAIRRYIKQHKP